MPNQKHPSDLLNAGGKTTLGFLFDNSFDTYTGSVLLGGE